MGESYSVRAVLSAVDKGFTSTLKSAMGATDSLGSKIKGGIGFGILTGIGQKAFGMITDGIRGLVSEIDSSNAAWKTFEGNMRMLDGWDTSSINAAKTELQEFAQKTVYSSSDMAQTFAQLAAVGVENTTELVKGFGGLAAAAENPQQAMKTLSQQATQMAAKPTVAWQDFKLMLEQTPAGIAAVAKHMGMSTSELVTAVQDGEVATTDFFNAINEVGNSDAFANLATEAKTMGQAMDGLKETIGNKLTPAFDVLSQIGIKAINGISDKLASIDAQKLVRTLKGAIGTIKQFWNTAKSAFSGVKEAVTGAISSLREAFADMGGTFTKQDALNAFKKICDGIAKAIKAVANFISKHADTIAKVFSGISKFVQKYGKYILGAFAAIKGVNLVKGIFGGGSSAMGSAIKSIGGGISQILKSVGTMTQGIGKGISTAFTGIGSGIKSVLTGLVPVIKATGTAAQGMGKGLQAAFTGIGKALKLANPMNILALGAAIGIVVAAFALLATQGDGVAKILQGIGSVVESVGTAIGNIASAFIDAIANALLKLAPVLPIISQSLVMLTPLVTAFGDAFAVVAVAVGDAVSKVVVALGEGIARITEALTPIVEIIGGVVTELTRIFVDGFVRITEALAPFIPVFTECFTKISEIVSAAIVKIVEAVAPYIPELTRMVESTSSAIEAICVAFTTLVEQIVPVVESVTNLISQLGSSLTEILGGVSELVTSTGESIATVIDSIGGAISKVIDSIAGTFESMGNAALNAGEGFKRLADGIKTITKLNLIDMAASLTAVGVSLGDLVRKSKGIGEAGNGMEKLVSSLKGLGANAAAGLAKTVVALEMFAQAAKKAGDNAGKDFTDGLEKGLNKAPNAAQKAVKAVTTLMLAGAATAYSAGSFLSIGFANGMESMLSRVKTAANKIVREANRAIEAAAKIGSPSKITTQYGKWYGEGFKNGITDMQRKVWNAAEDLFMIPNVATPNLAYAYAGELSADYEYYRSADYTISVPVNLDGKEVARVTAPYTQEELNKRQTREDRKRGRV